MKAIVGKHARIAWVKESQVLSFSDLTPAAVGAPEVFVGPEATEGVLPGYAVGIAGDLFDDPGTRIR